MKSFSLTFLSPLLVVSSRDDCMDINRQYLISVDEKILEHHCESIVESLSKLPSSDYWPRSLLMNDVYPFTVLTESPFVDDDWRPTFQARAKLIASKCDSIECIAMEMNEKIYDLTDPPIVFEAAPSNHLNSYSVSETLLKKKGSCTPLSVFLITALRMVGVPSRIVGVPHWNLGPARCPMGDASEECGNHNWVEVYVDGKGWSFLDQRRPDRDILPLNHSWFYPDFVQRNSIPRNGNHSVYAASVLDVNQLRASGYPVGNGVVNGDHFPMVWDWENHAIPAWDVSDAYSVNWTARKISGHNIFNAIVRDHMHVQP